MKPISALKRLFHFLQWRSYKYFRIVAMLTLTVDNVSTIVAVSQMLLSWCRANFWIWNDVVITDTC